MGKIRLNTDEIKYITLFETLTGATIKDCVQDDESIGFLVKKGDMGLAIGKNGANIERVKKAIGKGVWIMEFSDDVAEFMKNLFQPTRIKQIRVQNADSEKMIVLEINRKDYRRVIGLNGSRIRMAKKLAERHFAVDDIKIKSIY
ncbi:MAG: NusA-like transcription termination signal-binding factor [Candidatus Altiarchaeota archaeon]|nr:NusA-like transcription termination signal-binding factor [Candidatus Altiarchaeota archaeon]